MNLGSDTPHRSSADSDCCALASRWRRLFFSTTSVTAYWIINIATLATLATWIFSDGRFARIGLGGGQKSLQTFMSQGAFAAERSVPSQTALAVILVVAALSAAGIFAGLFFGSHGHRRIRSWFALTALVVLWLTLALNWPGLAWQGQAFRLERQLDKFRLVAGGLTQDWPHIDGERPGLGIFRAYPIEKPRVLMLMTQQAVPGTGLSFSMVERSESGALRFQLTGNETGAWLEWHPTGGRPDSFVGGLEQQYDVQRYSALGDDWYLVRYK